MDVKLSKKAFIEAYAQTFGNITEACKAIGIVRQTFYNWKANDPKFLAELESIEPNELFMDFIENKLIQKINDGDTATLIFVAKCRAKDRGYVERQEISHNFVEQPLFPDDIPPDHRD